MLTLFFKLESQGETFLMFHGVKYYSLGIRTTEY